MVSVMLVFTVLLAVSLSVTVEATRSRPSPLEYAQFFSRWLSSRNATYSSDMFQQRFAVYKDNWNLVDDHNERFRAGLESFTMALNQWADLSEGEYRRKLGFVDHSVNNLASQQPTQPPVTVQETPSTPRMLGDAFSDAMCQRFGIMCPARSSSTGGARSSSTAAARSSSSTGAARSSSAVPAASSSGAARSSSTVQARSSSTGQARSSSAAPASSAPTQRSSSSTPVVAPSSTASAAASSTGAPAADTTSIDWRQYGYFNPIRDQGQCGACWTFASVAVMEAAWAIKTGSLLKFSEQELLDCAANGARTCDTGGSMQDSWSWLISGTTRRSPMSQASYPYTTSSAASCLYDATRATNAVFQSRVYVQSTDAALVAAVQTRPAIAVAISGSGRAFQFYSSGVLSDSSCSSTVLDHAVVVVGYGTDATTGYDYWLIRNSWGTRWGEQGYAKIRRNFNNMCGITTQPTYVVA